MKIPVESAASEITIKGSRFLAESFLISSQSEAREKLSAQKKKYADATHVCHAFVCGKSAEIMGMSDDGEPGGTAGRPMLDVLKGSGITNILVTATRWFGGTLLGTGGLVKAYGDCTKSVIALTKTEELIEKTDFSMECTYEKISLVKKILQSFRTSAVNEEFGEKVAVSGKIDSSEFDDFSSAVFDKSNGTISVKKL